MTAGTERRATRLLAVERAMTLEEREQFLARFVGINPHYDGAHVADILDILNDSDSHLDVTEPLLEAHADEIGEDVQLASLCTLAAIYAHGEIAPDQACHGCWGTGRRPAVSVLGIAEGDCDRCEASGSRPGPTASWVRVRDLMERVRQT